MQNNITGFAAALGATAIWAGNFVAARALADQIASIQFNFWRWLVALIIMLPFAWPPLQEDIRSSKGHWLYLSLMAIVGISCMNTLIYKAGQTSPSLNMALIMPATPIVIMLLARAFYAEAITPRRLLGMLCASCGILLLISRGNLNALLQFQIQPGDLWTVAGMISFAVYSLFMRQRPHNMSSTGFNVIIFTLGLAFCLPPLIIEIAVMPLPKLNWQIISGIAYSGIGCSAISFWLWTIAIDKIGPVRSGIVYYSLPFFAAVMAKIALDENITAPQLYGGCLIIGGILLATLQTRVK